MIDDTTTCGIFDVVLRELGFTKKTLDDRAFQILGLTKETPDDAILRYEHPQPKTWVLFRASNPRDLVTWATFAHARALVDARGIIERADFNQLVRDTEAAHPDLATPVNTNGAVKPSPRPRHATKRKQPSRKSGK